MSYDFDTHYKIYSFAYTKGIDLKKELKKLEQEEKYELYHVIKTVIEDMNKIDLF